MNHNNYLFFAFLLIISFIPLVSSLEVDFSCPSDISEEEFECYITIPDNSASYDLKADILYNEKRVVKIWNKETWASTYYYVNNFLSDSERNPIKFKITESVTGELKGTLKLRENGKSQTSYEQQFVINSNIKNEESEEYTEQDQENIEDKSQETASYFTSNQELTKPETSAITSPNQTIINLNPETNTGKIIYESKNERIKNYAVYAFSLFLVFIIVILLIRR